MNYMGWDAGGAHLKAVRLDGNGRIDAAARIATPLWQGYERLEAALDEVCSGLDVSNTLHAVTMTAELADVFEDRSEGVACVIDMFRNKFGKGLMVYAGKKGLVEVGNAYGYFSDIASANWHAAGRYVAEQVDEGLLIDVGSTTTDIVGFNSGQVVNIGCNDQERLQNGELVYTGVVRMPVMAVCDSVPFGGRWQTLAAEHFATCADIYRVTGELDEEDDLSATADGRGKSTDDSIRRLARMLGRDRDGNNDRQVWLGLARYLSERQLQSILQGVFCILSRRPGSMSGGGGVMVGAGCGQFLIERLAERVRLPYLDFARLVRCRSDLHKSVCRCAPAVAVAHLARDNPV